ncbi:MAG: SUMF1/EgtB/PvdO family nonheme iron enzyme [Magnetococcales bacterium]|nr:SUMF1/EgtB/PvdO family nonheme iron enzyme [Magnetococcales bacterium]
MQETVSSFHTWLHLSDIHMGCRGEEIRRQVDAEFKPHLQKMVQQLGVPDMILLTGDLAFSGKEEEYQRLDLFLADLMQWIHEIQPGTLQPIVVPVPGNHDLTRPAQARHFRFLDDFGNNPHSQDLCDLRDELWGTPPNISSLEPFFKNYQKWLCDSIAPKWRERGLKFQLSHFPGDFRLEVATNGQSPLHIIGLNSAWMQYAEHVGKNSLEIYSQQLQTVWDGISGHRNLLLLHHPPAWFSTESLKRFQSDIYPPERFLMCLHGHMHEGRSETVAIAGNQPRYFFQAPSLLGLEHYGTSQEIRSIGYVWGRLTQDDHIHVWPMTRIRRGSGHCEFDWDQAFPTDLIEGIRIRPCEDTKAIKKSVPVVDLKPWLRSLHERCKYIKISGIGSGVGRGKRANTYCIEELYTFLKSHDVVERRERGKGGQDLEAMVFAGARHNDGVSLADLLPKYSRLFIEGQPGSGKTTFLRLAAAMLAKDLLGEKCPQGGTWRKRYLGMDDRRDAPIPLLLRLSELAVLLSDTKPPEKDDDRFRLLDLLQTTADAGQDAAWRTYWSWLLDEGRAILLLDGLDEVADGTIRERVFTIFQSAAIHWKKSTIIVSSRPIATEQLEAMGFQRSVIEPFAAAQMREFINRWSAALHDHAIGEQPTGEAGRHVEILEKAILDKPAIRKLASNPVMLTCLCVVHWNEGQLPEGRARVYRAVLRWLLNSREEVRTKAGYTNTFTLAAFSSIALTMMGDKKGDKKADIDLEDAANAILPLHDRHFPKITRDRSKFAREWVRLECVYSGILEEMDNNRLRFWHLTFQEYLAAQQLAWMSDDKTNGWWSIVANRLENAQWRETMDLFPSVLFDEGGERRVDELLSRVLEKYPGHDLAQDARKAGILGRILDPLKVYQYQPRPEIQRQYQQVLDRAMAIFTPEGAAKVSIMDRLLVAEALGQGGDPRLAEDRWRENLIKVPGTDIALGKYLVTVQEYQRFVDDGGYDNPDFWQEKHAWAFRKDEGWQEPNGWINQLDHPNWPVTGVSWYEALAYCRWLQTQKNVEFFLPEDEDWQAAATPAQGKYPWGNAKPTPELANYDKSKIGHATPVGLYPAGNGRYGHYDLAGNVWEWCATPITGSDVSDEDIQKYGPPQVARGGGNEGPEAHLRATVRARIFAGSRFVSLGFRVAAPASTVDP